MPGTTQTTTTTTTQRRGLFGRSKPVRQQTTTTRRRGLFGRSKPARRHHHQSGTTTTTAPVHHHKRHATLGDKVSGAMTKLKGSLTHNPAKKAAGTRRMHGTDGRGSRRVGRY